jgi:hypothetical protein
MESIKVLGKYSLFEKDKRSRIPAESAHILAKMYGIHDIILPLLEADEKNISKCLNPIAKYHNY